MDNRWRQFVDDPAKMFILGLALVSFVWFFADYFVGQAQQESKSQFVKVTNVNVSDYYYGINSHSDAKAMLAVNFTYHGRRYRHMLVIGSDWGVDYRPLINWWLICRTKFVDAATWQRRGIDEDSYWDYPEYHDSRLPKLDKVLVYNRENRISKDTVAIQVNKWYPSLNWQLKNHRVCLVMNK